MDLILKYRNKTCNFSGIVLKDFNAPVVNNVELDFEIEPAIWFKSLIIEHILIDCDLRNVFWQRKRSSDSSTPVKRSVFDDNRLEECELFNSVINLLQSREKKTCKVDDMSREILRILHLHVLPVVTLQDEDLPNLNETLSVVEKRITHMSELIVDKDKEIVQIERSLQQQREALFQTENFELESHLKQCSERFLTEILDDTNREIRSLTDKLITFQNYVDMTRDIATDDGKLNLLERRKNRDEVQSSILKLQCIREAVKNVTVRKKKKRKVKKTAPNDVHEAYIELKDKLNDDKSIIRNLFEEKVKTASVREAIIQACNDLITSGETTGCDLPKGGERYSTDILGNNIKPKKWLTLNERILFLLSNKSNEISQVYHHFVRTTVKKITEYLEERAIFDKKRDANIPFYMTITDFALPPRKDKQNGNAYENVSTEQHTDSPDTRFTQMLKEEVTQHIYDQCQLVVQLLSKQKSSEKKTRRNPISVNNVWVFYELQLYGHLIDSLSDLYEYIYREKATEMFSFVSQTSLKDLGIQEPWLQGNISDEIKDDSTASGTQTSSRCFDNNVAIVSLRNGGTITLSELCSESDDDFHDFFDSPSSDCDQFATSFDLCSIDENLSTSQIQIGGNVEGCEPCDIRTKQNGVFKPVTSELENMIRSKSIMGKLKSITKVNRLTSECVSCLKTDYCGHCDENALNAEDMLSGTILMLKQLDSRIFNKLYAHVHLVNDLIPPFMMGGIQDWSLTNFYCAFQCISCNIESKSEGT